MFEKLLNKRKLEAIKAEFNNFANLLTANPHINITNDEYNQTQGFDKRIYEHTIFFPLHGTYFETFCLEVICQLIYIVNEKQSIDDVPREVVEYTQNCIPIHLDNERIIKYFNGWGKEGRERKLPLMFYSIFRVTNMNIINNDNTTLGVTAISLFEKFVTYYLKKYELNDKQKVLGQWIDNLNAYSSIVKKGINIFDRCIDLAVNTANILLPSKSNEVTVLETMSVDGDVQSSYTNSFMENVLSDIRDDLSDFCMYVIKENAIKNNQSKEEIIFSSCAGIYFFDVEEFLNKYLDEYLDILPDSFFTMLQAEDLLKKEYATLCDELINLYKDAISVYQSLRKYDIEEQNEQIEKYFSMIKNKLEIYRNKKQINKKLIEKFDKYCDFVDQTIDIKRIINSIRKSQNLQSLDIKYTLGYQIESDILSFLFYLTSYNNKLENISNVQASLLSSLVINIDIQQEFNKYFNKYTEDFEQIIPLSFIVLLAYDKEMNSDVHYSEILYNFYKEIGDEYLQCISKCENSEHNKYHRYINRIYNYLKKYLKDVKVMKKTEERYSFKNLIYNPDLQSEEYNDYKVPLLSDEVVLNISLNTDFIEDNTYDDDENYDDEDIDFEDEDDY